MKKSFNEIYEEIYKESSKKLHKSKEKRISLLILLIFSIFMIYVMLKKDVTIMVFIFSLVLLIVLCNAIFNEIAIKHIFKEEVMKKLVEAYSNKLIFRYKPGTTYSVYNKSRFDKKVDKVFSEDLIKGNILENTPFEMSQVTAFRTEIDNEGHKHNIKTFKGLFGVVFYGNIRCPEVLVKPNKIINRFLENRIELDSAEFEKHYDLFSEDKIAALKLFTPEVIEKINDFKKKTGYQIEIKVVSEKIFFRIYCGEMFEQKSMLTTLDFSELYKYYCMIDSSIKIMEKIIENINNSKETVYI